MHIFCCLLHFIDTIEDCDPHLGLDHISIFIRLDVQHSP
jgi:hypothetical protein